MKQFLCLGAVGVLFLICTGCGDTFHPIIIPNPPTFPNPAAAHTVLTISDNGDVTDGSMLDIDVSGDSSVGARNLGIHPVHLVQQTGSQVLVLNQSDTTVPQDSVTKMNFSVPYITNAQTYTLPASYNASGVLTTSAPNFIATTESAQAYILLPQFQPNPAGGPITPSVAVLNTTNGGTPPTIAVSGNPNANPVAMAETPDGKKLYVANFGDSTVAGFNTFSNQTPTPRTVNGSFSAPEWIAARSDNQRVYVLGNGVVSTIDTTTTAGPDTVIDAINVPGAHYLWYDTILNRIYIPASGQLTVLDVSQSKPSVMAGGPIPITVVSANSRTADDPCITTAVGTLSVAAVTSLPDGHRAYVGAYYTGTNSVDGLKYVCPQVTVINTSTNAVKTVIAVPGVPDATVADPLYNVPACANTRDQVGATGNGFRIMMAAGGDSTRAYLSSCDGGNVNIINTSTDSYIQSSPASSSARQAIPPSVQNPPQSPVFMIAGP
jgi:hypothetical protein